MNSTTSRSSLSLVTLGVLVACGGGGGGGASTSTLSGEVRVPAVAPATLAVDAVDQPMQPGEVVVWLQPGTAPESLADSGFELVRSGGPIAVYRAHAAAGRASLHHGAPVDASVERATVDATAAMRQKPGVRVASPNYMLKASVEPNDQFYAAQWHYPQINLPQAWSITQGSSNVIVAVLDTGIASGHPDFDPARFVSGYDMISDPVAAGDGGGRDAIPEDAGDFETPQGSSFHGTHVAGTIGARSNNNVGVAGVDWNCKLMIVRVLGRGGGSVDDIANGILYAAGLANGSGVVPAQRADIVNMSLGGPGLNAVLEQACDAAANAGTLLIAAAGNDDTANPNSPAAFSSVLSVGAVDLLRARAPYSNFSTTVDVWAPGGDMSADRNGDTYADGVLSCSANDQGQFFYQFENGTSMASPHVAGVAALVKATNPSLTAAQIRAILIGNATTQAGSGLPNGGRIVDALLAVQAAGGSASGPLLVASTNNVDFGSATTMSTITLNNLGTNNLAFDSSSTLPAWLGGTITETITGNNVTDDTLELTVDRTGLPDDVYQAVVTLTYLDGATPVTIDITVRMQVGASTQTSDTIFLLLVDPITLDTLYQTSTTSGAGFAFSFGGVAAGNYLLVGGTDRDNDDFLGDPGELFGAWPDLDDPQAISVLSGVNSSDLDFGMQDLVTVQSAGALASRSFRRLR